MHVTTEPSDTEQAIAKMLRKLSSMNQVVSELSVDQKNHVNDLLRQLQAVLIGACVTGSILLFTHLPTKEVLSSVREMYESDRLSIVIQDLFRCLADDENLAVVKVEIGEDALKECEDGFDESGTYAVCSVCAQVSTFCP